MNTMSTRIISQMIDYHEIYSSPNDMNGSHHVASLICSSKGQKEQCLIRE